MIHSTKKFSSAVAKAFYYWLLAIAAWNFRPSKCLRRSPCMLGVKKII